ncbi:PAS domain S-box protein [Microvirga vignae]|uniref:sensor histidine kinase n=1 Tax=Microvirga vignae TaxID=1225564 RepID=UPI0031390F7C
MNIDIDAQKRTEAALRESEERLRLIVESARDYAILTTSPDNKVVDWYAGAAAVYGYAADEIRGRDAAILFTPEDREAGEHVKKVEIARKEGSTPNVRWHMRKDGRYVFIEGRTIALRNVRGEIQGYLKIGQDVTERKRADEVLKASEKHAKLLLAELQHRVRNTLGVIRSIARRTAATSETAEDYAMHLEGRIDSFARVQAVVTRDPAAGLNLEMIVADELRAVAAHEGEQVKSVSGPEVRLQPKAAETMALAIHELATNAVKYGALSAAEGRIQVTWAIDRSGHEPQLVFQWIETGVPLATQQPRRRGFGLELIERTLSYELGGEAKLDFTPDGLRCTISLPLDHQTFVLEPASYSREH